MNAPDATQAMKDVARKQAEAQLESTLKAYILDSVCPVRNKQFQYGGLINLLYTVGKIADQLADDADNLGCNEEALMFASKQIEDAAYAIDAKFLVNL